MKKLAVCIPNYNRPRKLERLLKAVAEQITSGNLSEVVEICVSDDCSTEKPDEIIESLRKQYTEISINFEASEKNMGMDYNFLRCVMMAHSEYCWIMGNDDMPAENGIVKAVNILKSQTAADIVLTPFDLHSEDGKLIKTVYPLKDNEEKIFDTSIQQQYTEFVFSVGHNCGLFGYLSNVLFRRSNWIQYKDFFRDKMDTIFIQMYINIQSLKDGAIILYKPDKIIDQYDDKVVNESTDRICRILIGLDGVVEYFFEKEEKEYLKRNIVDEYITGRVWELSDENPYRQKVTEIISPKNQLYKKYFIPLMERERFFDKKRFIIYGTGECGRRVYKELRKYGADVIGVADSAVSKVGTNFEEFTIMSVSEMDELCREQDAYVLVANHLSLVDIVQTLWKHRIEQIGIIT